MNWIKTLLDLGVIMQLLWSLTTYNKIQDFMMDFRYINIFISEKNLGEKKI